LRSFQLTGIPAQVKGENVMGTAKFNDKRDGLSTIARSPEGTFPDFVLRSAVRLFPYLKNSRDCFETVGNSIELWHD
jgi:hypothetical protein